MEDLNLEQLALFLNENIQCGHLNFRYEDFTKLPFIMNDVPCDKYIIIINSLAECSIWASIQKETIDGYESITVRDINNTIKVILHERFE